MSTIVESAPLFDAKLTNPFAVVINPDALKQRQADLASRARARLWDPRVNNSRGTFVFGFEAAQYGNLSLAELLQVASDLRCVVQPSGNHIDLARAATDADYREKVRMAFQSAEVPLLSISLHVDFYAAFAIRDNPRAKMFTPAYILEEVVGNDRTLEARRSDAHLLRIGLMLVGAAQLGIRAVHLFWGAPEDLPPYKWQPVSADEYAAMRKEFVRLAKPLIDLAARLGIFLGHEIHFGTIAMNADDLIEIWTLLGKPANFCVGIDPSHFWHGEKWFQAMDKLRKAGMKVVLAHAKNVVTFDGRPMLGHQADDRLVGVSFTSLDNPHGLVSFVDYGGFLTLSGIVEFWFNMGLPVPIYAEAENPFFDIERVTKKAVEFLERTLGGYRLPKGHFTDAMKR